MVAVLGWSIGRVTSTVVAVVVMVTVLCRRRRRRRREPVQLWAAVVSGLPLRVLDGEKKYRKLINCLLPPALYFILKQGNFKK